METLLANVITGKTRRATLHGREYIVAPATLISPGVLNGSRGAGLYPPEEVAKDPMAWNYMPIVVYHPTHNGQPVSGRSPEVLEKQWIGNVFNATGDGKLASELWFEIEATRRVDPRILQALEDGKPIELSTGLHLDAEPAPRGAVHNSPNGPKPYTFIARNMKPDHLAVLPDQIGACSIQDGCGVLVNEDERSLFQRFKDWLTDNKKPMADVSPAKACEILKDGSVHGEPLTQAQRGMFGAICDNGAGTETQADHAGSAITNGEPVMAKLSEPERTSLVDYLVANCDCWKDGKDILNGLPDERLATLKKHAEEHASLVANMKKPMPMEEDEEDDEDEMPKKKKKPAMNVTTNTTKPVTANEWLASAPPEVRSAVQNAMEIERQAKTQIVQQLTSNTERQQKLMTLTLDDLRERLADTQEAARQAVTNQQIQPLTAPNYLGAAGGSGTVKDDSDNVLPVVTINWDDMASPRLRKQA